MLVFVLRESVFHLLPGWTIRFRASVVTSRERGRFDVLLTVFPPLESVFGVVFDHTLLVLMITTLLLFLLFLSLSRVVRTPKKSKAREEDDRMGDGRDAVCSRREKTTTNSRDEEREEEKKVSQKSWKSGKPTDAESSSFCIFFLRPLSCCVSSVCPFFLKARRVFLLFCASLCVI